jgi:hypothetical protein
MEKNLFVPGFESEFLRDNIVFDVETYGDNIVISVEHTVLKKILFVPGFD